MDEKMPETTHSNTAGLANISIVKKAGTSGDGGIYQSESKKENERVVQSLFEVPKKSDVVIGGMFCLADRNQSVSTPKAGSNSGSYLTTK